MDYEYLKETLGEELYGQFTEKMQGSGIELVNARDGSYIPKAKFDEEVTKLQGRVKENEKAAKKVAELEAQVAEKDKAITGYEKKGKVAAALREAGARDEELLLRLIDLDSVTFDDKDGLSGLEEQLEPIRKKNPYLFHRAAQRGGVDAGGMPPAGSGRVTNQAINDEIRRASGRM